KASHLAMKRLVGEDTRFALGLADPDQRRLVASRTLEVTIETVVGDVQRAADEPLRERRLPVEHALPARAPAQLSGHVGPESFWIVERAAVQRVVGCTARNARSGGERRRRSEHALLTQHRLDGGRPGGVAHRARRVVGDPWGAQATSGRGQESARDRNSYIYM